MGAPSVETTKIDQLIWVVEDDLRSISILGNKHAAAEQILVDLWPLCRDDPSHHARFIAISARYEAAIGNGLIAYALYKQADQEWDALDNPTAADLAYQRDNHFYWMRTCADLGSGKKQRRKKIMEDRAHYSTSRLRRVWLLYWIGKIWLPFDNLFED